MEAPISKTCNDNYWHQTPPNTSAFKSPDLIELNSDSERNVKPVEPLNYSSSQEEVETEDDCCDAPESTLVKEGIPSVYDVTSNDEESCHLLQTEDDSDSDSEHIENSSKSSVSRSSSSAGEATISDGEVAEEHINSRLRQCSLDNYWDMSLEQEKYYTEQFLLLQPDLNGMVSGADAKGFFEKSKLPHTELRQIWEIADVKRRGCLDLSEFKIAMHLVVLRRHGLQIPTHPDGRPLVDFHSSNKNAGNGSNIESITTNTSSTTITTTTTTTSNNNNTTTSISNTTTTANTSGRQLLTPPTKTNLITTTAVSAPPHHVVDRLQQSKKPSKDWTTFDGTDEPVNFSSTCDTSNVCKPVPVRLTTPEDKLFLSNSASSSVAAKSKHLQGLPRPKLSYHHPKVSATAALAPPPPPRRKTHVRSSSLDLNRLNISSDIQKHQNNLGTEVSNPPRNSNFLSPSHQGGAFSVYRKPQPPSTTIHEPPSSLNPKATKVQLKQEVIDLKNENTILNRISTQLLDQLSGLTAKKKALQIKIQQLNTLPSGGRIS